MRPTQDVTVRSRVRRSSAYHELEVLDRYSVDESTGCWEWLGARLNKGYGRCKVGNQPVQAHRVFYAHHVGPIPDGHDIHHRCGNKGCVNPEHLEPLTRAENTRRKPHGHTLLTWDEADEIRAAVDEMCARYGVKPRTLAAIGERQIWKPEERA